MRGQISILDWYKELIKINKISTEKEVNVGNGKEIKGEKFFNIDLSFGKVSEFKVDKEISFTFIGFTIEQKMKDENISILVNLIKNKNELEGEAICASIENVESKDEKQIY